MKHKYSKELVEKYVLECTSIRQVCLKLGISGQGGNFRVIKKFLKDNEIDISHFSGRGWLKGRTHSHNKIPLEDILKENSNYQSYKLKNRLLQEGIKDHRCECCSLEKWNNKPIPIELDHINGINTDNRLENLRILCPNCHAQTDTYRGKNIKN